MSNIKLLINGEAGSGKTSLLSSLGEETFVVSRDNKKFSLDLPHMMVENYYNMNTFLYGSDGDSPVEGIVNKIENYYKVYNKYPETVVIDSVSQIIMDVLDKASQTPDSWGSQGKEITKELALLNKFIHETLEMEGFNVILLNHVMPELSEGSPTGNYTPFGQGQFKNKGGFYATTNEAITLVVEGSHRCIYTRGLGKHARTSLKETPDKLWAENLIHPDKSKKLKEGEYYFNLKDYIDLLVSKQVDTQKWSL